MKLRPLFQRLLLARFLALSVGQTAAEPLAPAALETVGRTVEAAIADGRFTGAVVHIQNKDDAFSQAYGKRSVDPEEAPALPDTIFDVASLTKVVATTPSIMILVDRKRVDPDAPVSRYIPEFVGEGREKITVAQLFTHTSGLPPILPRTDPPWTGYGTGTGLATRAALRTEPGKVFRYSDVNFILLGEIVHRVSGQRLDAFSAKEIFAPLGMKDTQFTPPRHLRPRIAPTERTAETGLVHGVVHDPAARAMDGVAGHAGLFSTVPDLARYCAMVLNKGVLGETRVLSRKAVAAMTRDQMPGRMEVRRGYGWAIQSDFSGFQGERFSERSFGHTGWTGGAFWIDPAIPGFAVFMANRNHPVERSGLTTVRQSVFTAAAEAMGR